MREIKFRGKRMRGEWVYGDIHKNVDFTRCHIHPVGERILSFDVKPETAGQFTGLKDKNGKEIYEGDVYTQGDPKIKYVVTFRDGAFVGKQLNNKSTAGLAHWIERIEVVGNIHEGAK